jgi:uncharacterized protein YdhG (YjbR/CyaY superfamily)
MKSSADVHEYIAGFPSETQKVLKQVRSTIKKLLPEAEETISYGVPTFKINGNYVVYFAGFKKHLSIYPAPRGHEKFKHALSKYKGGKGTVQFPLDEPLPLGLISRIVKQLKKSNAERAKK